MRLSLEDTLHKVSFGRVLIMTDRPDQFAGLAADVVEIANAPNKPGWEKQRWFDLPPLMTTDYSLFMEWDAGVVDPALWDDEFLNYDYIGAPWWYGDGLNVGNAGFCLRSRKLMDFLAENGKQFPCVGNADDTVCRIYRRTLEVHGFKWPTDELAHKFSFECWAPHPTFGYHAMRNWPHVFEGDDLVRRTKLALNNPYIGRTDMMQQLFRMKPELESLCSSTGLEQSVSTR